MVKVRTLWSRGGFVLKSKMRTGWGQPSVCPSLFALSRWRSVLKQREDGAGAGELLTRQQHPGILRRPFQPPPAAARLLLLLVSPWELAGERVFGVGDV